MLNFREESFRDQKANHEIDENIVPRKFGAIRYLEDASSYGDTKVCYTFKMDWFCNYVYGTSGSPLVIVYRLFLNACVHICQVLESPERDMNRFHFTTP